MIKEQLIAFEDEIKILWETGKIRVPVHFCGGNEEELIEIFKEIREADYVFCSHRNHYHYLLHGGNADALKRGMLGLPDGLCAGRAGSMGTIDVSCNFYSSAIVGGLVAVAVGVAWAIKQKQLEAQAFDDTNIPVTHVWCFCGDGALDGGHFWEAVQYAIGYELPVTFIVEHNNRATCTTVGNRLGIGHLPLEKEQNYLRWYHYTPTYPHVGSGKYVQF